MFFSRKKWNAKSLNLEIVEYFIRLLKRSCYTGGLNKHATCVTAQLFLPIQYMYIYGVSQYTWEPGDC